MTMQQLKREAAALSAAQQVELAAYLVYLRNQNDPALRRQMSRRLADRDDKHWLTPAEFEKRLGKN